jgi:hypothetical protein
MIHRLAVAAAIEAGLETREICQRNKSPRFSWPRFAAMAVAHERGKSYPQIATGFGLKDHTSALHGCRRAAEMEHSSPAFAALMAKLRDLIPVIHTDPSSLDSSTCEPTDRSPQNCCASLASTEQRGA